MKKKSVQNSIASFAFKILLHDTICNTFYSLLFL